MPAEPVPLTGKVSGLAVAKTCRRRSLVASRMAKNSGSRCPRTGPARAWATSGYGLEGPGPINRRSEIGTGASWQNLARLRQRAPGQTAPCTRLPA